MEFSKNKWVNIGILFLLVMVACVAALLVVTQKEVKDKEGNVIGTRGSLGYMPKSKKAATATP